MIAPASVPHVRPAARARSPRPIPAISRPVEGTRALYHTCKRAIDLAGASLLLLLLLPLILLIAGAITLDTRGPVFFVQERVGARRRSDGGRTRWETRPFFIYKFRSMAVGSDSSLHEQHVRNYVAGRLEGAGASAKFKLPRDSRVTRVGRLLRRTSLDELPQLFNVLKGEMSLVGPRPVPAYEVAGYREGDKERLTALPGITGLWQVNGRADVPFAEMMRLDREYVRRQSLWLDVKILAATLPAVLSGRGAE
jgi:lipopolysaccharide/colanic/teichoic acid biosynthesis glycosyltransferase